MTTIGIFVEVLGFDPTRLSGRPTGYAMLYWLGLSFALVGSGALVFATSIRWVGLWRWIAVAGAVLGLTLLTAMQHTLFIEYPGQETVPADTGLKETYIVPIPMPGLRSPEFDEHWAVGSPNYKNASPSAYEAEGRKPENVAGTFATVLLHWALLMLCLSCLFAMSALALKAVIARLFAFLRPR